MKSALKISVVLLLCLSFSEGTKYPQLGYLNNLVSIIDSEATILTIITVQHSLDQNCTLQHWNPRGIPIIRANELTSFQFRGVFNKQLMAMVCIADGLGHTLLNALAKILENLRQERIILWTQKKPTERLLSNIARQSIKLKFLQIIVLATEDQEVTSMYRMNAFPTPRFVQYKNISSIPRPVFRDPRYSFQGLTAFVKIPPNLKTTSFLKTVTGNYFPITRVEDMEVFEFAKKYNLSLKLRTQNSSRRDHFDIQLNPRFIRRKDTSAVDFVNPSSISSLIVVVPCSYKRGFTDFLRKLDVLTWLLYLLPVYATFVLVETLVLVVTSRMTREPYRLTILNPLLNLRAFRAILGLPYPELRRASISLRQLSIVITIFGFIFSNFFSCKLSAMLTRPLGYPEVRNFEELRATGLTTVTERYLRTFIESEIDPEFFNQVIPKFMTVSPADGLKLLVSLNDSFSYVMYTNNWILYDKFQRLMGKIVLCTSEDLTIVQNLPRMYLLESNSIFRWMLTRFIMYFQESGIIEHYRMDTPRLLKKAYNITTQRIMENDVVPISLQQLKWLWQLLAIGYGIAAGVFIVEILVKKM